MVSRDWAEQHIHECIVGSPCGFCPALNLGLRAISLISARLDFPLMISPLALPLHGPTLASTRTLRTLIRVKHAVIA